MGGAQVVALVAFVLLATVVALVARRMGALLQRTRVAEGFRGDVTDLARRIEQSLGDVSVLIDAVRRGTTEADAVRPSLEAARDAVDRYAEEARRMGGPGSTADHRQAMVMDLDRAGRALELVDHGCTLALVGRRHERDAEAGTSIKRGYLNLIHARESIAEHARAAAVEAESASPVRRLSRRAP